MPAFRLPERQVTARLRAIVDRQEETARIIAEQARNVPDAKRKELAKKGHALSDGSYPIENSADLKNAATLAASGHGNVSAAKVLIRKRAKELGVKVESLPGFGTAKAAKDSTIDSQVRKAIESAIDLQRKDPDLNTHDADRRVLELLHSALEAQMRDEATDTPSSGGSMY